MEVACLQHVQTSDNLQVGQIGFDKRKYCQLEALHHRHLQSALRSNQAQSVINLWFHMKFLGGMLPLPDVNF